MKTTTLAVCDRCQKCINPNEGYIIKGNVYTISDDVTERNGIIGNAFLENQVNDMININNIYESAYHHTCLLNCLNENAGSEITTTGEQHIS